MAIIDSYSLLNIRIVDLLLETVERNVNYINYTCKIQICRQNLFNCK